MPHVASTVLYIMAALLLHFAASHNHGDTLTRRLDQQLELDQESWYHVHKHTHGTEAVEWLSNHGQVISAPALPAGHWPDRLIIGYAGGYDFEILKPFIYGFLVNVEEPAWLVLLTPTGDIPGLPDYMKDRIIVQKHEMPAHIPETSLPYPVSLRFYITAAFLRVIQHEGYVFFCDTRDVFLQRDPFKDSEDGVMHFPHESSAYRLKGPYTLNADWLLQCYGKDTMSALGGFDVLNSGTLLGPSWMMLRYFELMLAEFQHRWHCMRLHGSDQAVHNYLVYTGKLIGTGLEFIVDNQITGRFAFVAYTHPAVWDLRYVNDDRDEMYNKVGEPYAAIHLWPGDNAAANKVVLPFIAEYERNLISAAKLVEPKF